MIKPQTAIEIAMDYWDVIENSGDSINISINRKVINGDVCYAICTCSIDLRKIDDWMNWPHPAPVYIFVSMVTGKVVGYKIHDNYFDGAGGPPKTLLELRNIVWPYPSHHISSKNEYIPG
ncbi:TPA: hypothetical protein JGU28_004563 [Salmonella enterica]|nr:hypothetical protein [Salmonella enterica]